jgi:hypothetical protein
MDPAALVVAADILITGVFPPLEAIGAVPDTEVTPPPPPLPSIRSHPWDSPEYINSVPYPFVLTTLSLATPVISLPFLAIIRLLVPKLLARSLTPILSPTAGDPGNVSVIDPDEVSTI